VTEGQRGAPRARSIATATAILLVPVAIGVVAAWIGFRSETARLNLDRTQAGAAAARLTEEVLHEDVGAVVGTAAFTSELLRLPGRFGAQSLHRFFGTIAASLAESRQLAWHPLVSHAERAAWEGETGITIVDRGPEGTPRTAAQRAEYLPLLYSYSGVGRASPQGSDISLEPGRDAIAATRRSGAVALGQSGVLASGARHMFLARAVFRGQGVPTTAERRRRFVGVVAMTLSGDAVLRQVLRDMGNTASGLALVDSRNTPIGRAGQTPGGHAESTALRGAGTGLTVVVDGSYDREWGVVIGAGFGGLLLGVLGIGAILVWGRRLRDAQRRADSDSLTGLTNRRVFQQKLATEIARAKRHGRPLSLALIDVDHFKSINDTYGHPVGDRLLIEVSRLLVDSTRAGEVVARLGGDEFGWILPDTEASDAFLALERLRAIVADAGIDEGRATLSVGIAQRREVEDAEGLMECADAALYRAKGAGRDCVVLFSSDLPETLSARDLASRVRRDQGFLALRALARTIDGGGRPATAHSERVATLCVQLATALGWTSERVAMIHQAALIHNVGHMTVPEHIIEKDDTLRSPDERHALARHAEVGAEMAARVLSREQASWVRHHHERFDGLGFPAGLTGHDIPEGARMIALADGWETLSSQRAKNKDMTLENALGLTVRDSGSRFCPEMVGALSALVAADALFALPPAPSGGPNALRAR
jgi:diguanylate cyclase (GGDEF)-like protein